MYLYNEQDQKIIEQRVSQFQNQTDRYLAGELSNDEFLPLRLQNGLYIQRLAPMLRIAVPYGLLNSTQLRKLARITRLYDKGYCHVTTRQNIQLNWPKLEDVPKILAELAQVQMHAVQTSGNCIRNTTSDQFAGASKDELEDPRPWCEIIRQWSTFHPEFAFLPRKFKIAVCGTDGDRAAIQVHDIGIQIVKNSSDELGFKIFVGGGLGRTPVIGSVIREFLPQKDLLTYLDAILRVYNRHGNRSNKYQARIKILVKAWTPEVFAQEVEDEWDYTKDTLGKLTHEEINRVKEFFTLPPYENLDDKKLNEEIEAQAKKNVAFDKWLKRNVRAHKIDGYSSVTSSLKPTGVAPGGDFCSLANAKSIPIAESIQRKFEDIDYVHDLGDLSLNISGCMNACGHHHVGNIGILGVDKKGAEFYQIQLGGSSGIDASLAKVLGPSFGEPEVPDVIEKILNVYVSHRKGDELFIDTYRRIGADPFKEKVYPKNLHQKKRDE